MREVTQQVTKYPWKATKAILPSKKQKKQKRTREVLQNK
jgi:hypothetical protein